MLFTVVCKLFFDEKNAFIVKLYTMIFKGKVIYEYNSVLEKLLSTNLSQNCIDKQYLEIGTSRWVRKV